MILRPYQEEALRELLTYAIEHPTGRALIVLPPRAGKTFTAAHGAKMMAIEQGLPALWVAPSVEPLDEAVTHLIDSGIPRAAIGVVYRGRPASPDALFQVTTESTIDRKNKPRARVVIWDEAHHDPAPRRRRIRALYPDAFHIGLTGTPERLTGAGLAEDYDILIAPVQPSELIHDGHLAVPTVYAPEPGTMPKLRRIRTRMGDYDTEALEKVMLSSDHIDSIVQEWDRLAKGRRTLIYAVTVKHSEAIAEAFQGQCVNAFHIDGTTPPGDRKEILDALAEGDVEVVTSVGVFSEALNLPRIKCCILARPTRSRRLHIQQGSRCMTPWGGLIPRILDLVGNCDRLGFPFDDQDWKLETRAKRPGTKQGGLVRRCPAEDCGALAAISAKVCGACGVTFDDLVVPTPLPKLPPLKLREVVFSDEERAAKRARLEAFAATKGYEKVWVEKVMALVNAAQSAPAA